MHDPAHADYRPFALPPPALRPGVEPRAVFDTLDADQSGTLSVAELKQMAELEQLVQMPEPSEAGIREGYFGSQYGELLQPVRHTPPCRHAEVFDGSSLLVIRARRWALSSQSWTSTATKY